MELGRSHCCYLQSSHCCYLYIGDDFQKVDRSTPLQETIVSIVVAGVIVGAAIGGWMNNSWGRRISILIVDVLFAIGAIVVGIAPSPGFIILGRVFVGLGVGMVSMTAPLYISEASPTKIREALHAFLTSFLFYQDRKEEAATILKKLYPPHEVEAEVEALRLSVEAKIAEEGSIGAGNIFTKIKNAWSNTVVRRGLTAGIGCQVIQQFVGINTVMYYSPTIVQLAGYASNGVALTLSFITSGLNAFGSIVSMLFVDKYGRRKLLLVSMVGIIIYLFMLTSVFEYAKKHAPAVSGVNTATFENSNCVHYTNVPNAANWDCVSCLAATDNCGFYTNSGDHLRLAFEEVDKKLARTWKAWENHSDDEDSTSVKTVP
ncbi:hypothetical protein GIB67_018514 [Kingdonia uniflora]|uniref:Major facilitator superfamily (MFS) profile domain-containing protein n=1 Tax=Kingdonia uniflora TaxID=39325 RepID=A0A7J7LW22_9MAGN|nr:hypothetical protein GIB67_018514 [Kingdonia uniflora]